MDPTFQNRLAKNWKALRPWAEREGLTAWRLYDRDTPEVPLEVELYGEHVHVTEFPNRRARREGTQALRTGASEAIEAITGIPLARIHWKQRIPLAPGGTPLPRPAGPGASVTCEVREVREGDLRFEVNLTDFWDTGLFLDHRLTRARVRKEVHGARFLNLFGYTGSFTVYAAAGGARGTTTVDLSQTYLDWARRNLTLNQLAGPAHALVRADVLEWLEEARARGERYDCVVLDPPSFSRSKAMRGTFEIQRDHPALIAAATALLAPAGTLYFSTNLATFRPAFPPLLDTEELTPRSLPRDFTRKDAHRCWRISGSR